MNSQSIIAPSDLHHERIETVAQIVMQSRARRVIDLGCGTGEMLARLAREAYIEQLTGIDISIQALQGAAELLGLGPAMHDSRISLIDMPFTRADERLTGFDTALMVETIEHVAPNHLSLVEQTVFAYMRPRTMIITTPNQEYNVAYGLPQGVLRHPGHYFEWSRAKFRNWINGVSKRNGYSAIFGEIGTANAMLGSPTQMTILSRCDN